MRFNSKVAFNYFLLAPLCLIIFLSSCITVRNYPTNKPFIFENKITIKGNIPLDEKQRLELELNNYWDDSMKANRVQQLGFLYKLKSPPVYDSSNLARSRLFMSAYLNSQGYYYAKFAPLHRFDTTKGQIRTTVGFAITIGKIIKIDTVSYSVFDSTKHPVDSTMQKLTLAHAKSSLLKKGNPYTKEIVNSELDRLVGLYHQNGYFKFTRDNIYALVDTVDTKLLTLTLDPFLQAEMIAEAEKKRRENPSWGITILQRQGRDTAASQQFYTGRIYYYPDLKDAYFNPDSVMKKTYCKTMTDKQMTIYYTEDKFRFNPLRDHTYLLPGKIYNEDLYYKSVNRLSQIGAWKEVDIKPIVRGKDSIDLYVFMVPEKKQGYTVDQELSKNTGDIASGNLLGIATNFSYKNRNIAKRAIQSVTTLRFGVELNLDKESSTGSTNPLLQTTQASLSNTYIFPRLLLLQNNGKFWDQIDNKRTLFTVAGSYTDRKNLYQLRSLVSNVGWEGSIGNNSFVLKPINVELYKVDTLAGLDSLFKTNPFLRNSFKDGKVVGLSASWTKTFVSRHNPSESHFMRFGWEESGSGINQISKESHVYGYNKLEGEYRYIKRYRRAELATRLFTGIGLHSAATTMPVFKEYFLGGPNSMRAWGLRQLGLGSSLASDTTTAGYTDRFGDFTMEANIEYRFPLGSISGVKIGSALYTDIGNLWDIHKVPNDPNATISLDRLGHDLAIGVGTGIRVDFSYFLIRVDFAYKLKDPARLENNGWLNTRDFEWTATRANGLQIKNYAFQLGIGLPF